MPEENFSNLEPMSAFGLERLERENQNQNKPKSNENYYAEEGSSKKRRLAVAERSWQPYAGTQNSSDKTWLSLAEM